MSMATAAAPTAPMPARSSCGWTRRLWRTWRCRGCAPALVRAAVVIVRQPPPGFWQHTRNGAKVSESSVSDAAFCKET